MQWPKLSLEEINQEVKSKLLENTSYSEKPIFGVPASWLNKNIFPDIDFLNDAPFLRTMVENPNHIGCHTSGTSEKFFKGTQSIEREVIRICAEEILKAQPETYDGYIASGGTEGNIQGLWTFRNFLMKEKNAKPHEIGVIFSEDSHYSANKACNLLCLNEIPIKVSPTDRQMDSIDLSAKIEDAKKKGIKYFVAILSMGTTMFGSVDKFEQFQNTLLETDTDCMIHIDAAFGGFIYPFSGFNILNFEWSNIVSVSLDGHKILQSPYGTGVFICKKPMLEYVSTSKASYVEGFDKTLIGSRSGALAVSMWMILSSYGSKEWDEFMGQLISKTDRLERGLKEKSIPYFREKGMNVITVPADSIPNKLFKEFYWVADNVKSPKFFKAVVMEHVTSNQIDEFLNLI